MYLYMGTKDHIMPPKSKKTSIDAWTLDQIAKSVFFHRKLHEWKLSDIAQQIDNVQGEHLDWDDLNISLDAWNKIIHRGIRPVVVFAHPYVLQAIAGSVSYYRMLAMVSQKSMDNVGLDLKKYETGKAFVNQSMILKAVHHLNQIISVLIEIDGEIASREFDLWRGMAAGSQAQGSWQNNKGTSAETTIRELVLLRLQERQLIKDDDLPTRKILVDHRILLFADDPDIAFYNDKIPEIAIEIKGGIDPAAVLERIGAALKSLRRIRQENSEAVTILILPDMSLTARAHEDLGINIETVTHLFATTELLEDESERERFFSLLKI